MIPCPLCNFEMEHVGTVAWRCSPNEFRHPNITVTIVKKWSRRKKGHLPKVVIN